MGICQNDFIAVTQVMVYVGGILVLVLFTVMMTRVPLTKRTRHGLDRYVPAAVFSMVHPATTRRPSTVSPIP